MPGLRPDIDPDGLLEYSVVFTDRSLNHMSGAFQGVMNDVFRILTSTYGAHSVVLVPGGGTYAMEAVARQLASGKRTLVIRNGFFSFRWSQIFEFGGIPAESKVLKARRLADERHSPFAPAPLEEVLATIEADRPHVVFAPHVETASGMILPDDYVRQVAAAVHAVGGLFVLDCIASGTVWVDMRDLGVDVLISAPQKGWSGSPCAGLVMLSEAGLEAVQNSTSSSFACDLRKWHDIMRAYRDGGHAYHATLPTDGIRAMHEAMLEAEAIGMAKLRDQQIALGQKVRELLEYHGFNSVAAEGFKSPGVVVSYTDDPDIQNGKKFAAAGLQVAAGVPLMCDEPDDYMSFRLGLFGLDKLGDVQSAVARLSEAVRRIN